MNENTTNEVINTESLPMEIEGEAVTTEEVIGTEAKIEFHPENFVGNLSYMGQGMLGIFIVIGIIALVTVTLSKISGKKE